MKLYNYKYLILSVLIALGACTDNFEEANTNPNNPTDVPTSYLMTQGQRAATTYILSVDYWNEYGVHYTQQLSQTQYTSITRYDTPESNFSGWYSGPLSDFQKIIELNSDAEVAESYANSGSANNQIAVARIMKVLLFQHITDFWGDIPYSQALTGSDNFQPGYDAQSDIYADFVTELKEASAQIDGGLGVQGDIYFDGDMDAWKKFANSLLMRVGIRMTNVNPSLAQDAITSALANGVFESNDDNASYTYLSDANNSNPLYYHFNVDSRTDYAISDILVGMLKDIDDPRLPIYADPAEAPTDPADVYIGMPYGISDADAGSITNASISFPGSSIRQATYPGYMMTYSEVCFIKAEAAERSWIEGDAATFYEEGITASMEQWGVASDDITAYLAQPEVAYDGFESIGYQKYYALYLTGLEAYAEFRRTGYPELSPAPAAILDAIPRRLPYPQIEKDLNAENLDAAVSRMGGDLHSTRVWWDGGN
ncbi:SusD/RagB family nutrient-binding outer membrane lipoprotein [Chondrinema litorale]|uniref:SusD/RagB family nutrient-binding outer membrane lipoprotein n=1 Tax=Chondrinema litorale TaxID=2994555 RepID=UPI002543AD38|nr:SusD/RagB family nutrient-binding outer membrane lipoprotein [Chondrinema litorale]UZR96992.1 SusD/RagB family nutrient-binding outer membrane lipoprotein [Chondrinema litorale]